MVGVRKPRWTTSIFAVFAFAVAAVLATLCLVMAPTTAFAEGAASYTGVGGTLYVKGESCQLASLFEASDGDADVDDVIVSAVSSNESVALVRHVSGNREPIGSYSYWYVDPVGAGTATITITDASGASSASTVEVKHFSDLDFSRFSFKEDGTLNVSVGDALESYTYTWDNATYTSSWVESSLVSGYGEIVSEGFARNIFVVSSNQSALQSGGWQSKAGYGQAPDASADGTNTIYEYHYGVETAAGDALYALAEGEGTLTLRFYDPEMQVWHDCDVRAFKVTESEGYEPQDIDDAYIDSSAGTTLQVGGVTKLSCCGFPVGYAGHLTLQDWSVEDGSIASVAEDGTVTALSPGVTYVQATLAWGVQGKGGGWYLPKIRIVVTGDTADVTQAMYRLYNPNSGEHFYTANADERSMLIGVGWNDEGIGWYAPKTSNTPVYRMYNSNPSPKTGSGEHHYTISAEERDSLVAAGWQYEGVGWYSTDESGAPLYRVYNPNEFNNNHHYTTSTEERDHLLSLGWHDEGIAWYGV